MKCCKVYYDGLVLTRLPVRIPTYVEHLPHLPAGSFSADFVLRIQLLSHRTSRPSPSHQAMRSPTHPWMCPGNLGGLWIIKLSNDFWSLLCAELLKKVATCTKDALPPGECIFTGWKVWVQMFVQICRLDCSVCVCTRLGLLEIEGGDQHHWWNNKLAGAGLWMEWTSLLFGKDYENGGVHRMPSESAGAVFLHNHHWPAWPSTEWYTLITGWDHTVSLGVWGLTRSKGHRY